MSNKPKIAVRVGETQTSPEKVGYVAERLDRLDEHFLDLIEQEKLQCASYLLARHGKVFACKSMGRLRYDDDGGDFLPDSIRRIASITKAFAAVAVMKLVEDGLLYLQQPVASIIDEFDTDIHKGITIWHLLTHTAGLPPDPGYFTEPYPMGWWHIAEGAKAMEQDIDWIKAILCGPLHAEPGEEWVYSSAGFCILGEIVSRVSGTPVEEYILQTIAQPIGMTRSFFDVPKELHDQVCITNDWGDKGLKRDEDRSGRPPRTAGGLYSTLPDLYRFAQMLLNLGTLEGVRILGRKAVEAMTRNWLIEVPAFQWGGKLKRKSYGLGLEVRVSAHPSLGITSPDTYNHEGAGRCAMYIDPAEQLIAVYMVPTTIDWLPESVINPQAIIWSGLE
jgi:CubicO group peptidase (beta-lactamase class C family)